MCRKPVNFMELKTQVKALNYTKKLLMGETESILPWAAYPQKPIFRQTSRQITHLPTAEPEEKGISSQSLQDFLEQLAAEPQAKAHCFLVARQGKLLFSADFKPYTKQLWHISHSLCKSLVGIAIGILVDREELSLETPLSEVFPQYFNLFTSRRTKALTIRHLLTMSSGINFREIGAVLEKDWLRSYFEADVMFEPGTQFEYNSMNSYVLGCVVQKISKKSLSEFLTEFVFNPLGFGAFEWETCPMGREKGGWGLYLMPEDMVKLGILLLNNGVWSNPDGTEARILSEQWVKEMTSTQIRADNSGYGFHIWTFADGSYTMNGMYGQYVYCVPKNDLVVVLCSGSTNIFADSAAFELMKQVFAQKTFPSALPASAEGLSSLCETANHLKFNTPLQPPPVEVHLPWYKRFLQRLAQPAQPEHLPTQQEQLQAMLAGRCFEAPNNKMGILPLMIQCMQSNYTQGVKKLEFFEKEQQLQMAWQEGEDMITIPLNFAKPEEFQLLVGAEQWKVASIAQAATNEDGVAVLKVSLCFLEHTSVRTMKIFFYPKETLLRMEETPSMSKMLVQMKGNPQADLILDMFKDASYARYRFERFCSPEILLQPKA